MKKTYQRKTLYRDIQGRVWESNYKINGVPHLWNDEIGEGLWDEGRNLTQINLPENETPSN